MLGFPEFSPADRVIGARLHGLEVRCAERPGYAFVYEPSRMRLLVALHDRDEDTHPEVWSETGPEQVVRRVLPWAFPRRWTVPEPVDRKAEKRRLEKIAGGLFERGRVSCQIAEMDEKLMGLLTPEGQRTLEQDRKVLSSRRLVQHFPWDSRGRLSLKTTVLLKPYEMIKPPGRGRDVCLVVRGPERRQEEQRNPRRAGGSDRRQPDPSLGEQSVVVDRRGSAPFRAVGSRDASRSGPRRSCRGPTPRGYFRELSCGSFLATSR